MTLTTTIIQNNSLFDSTSKSIALITDSLSVLFNKTLPLAQSLSSPIPSLISKDLVCMNYQEWILDIDQYQQRLLEFEFSDEDTIRSFIEGSPPPLSTNREKIKFLINILSKTENKLLFKILLEKIKPEFHHNDITDILFQGHTSDYNKIIPLISQYYIPQNLHKEFALLESLLNQLDRKDFMLFWEANRGYFTDFSLQSKAAKRRTFGHTFLKFLKEQGADSRLFNIAPKYGPAGYGPPSFPGTAIQELIRKGEIEYVRELLKEIPLSEVEYGDYFFPEEIRRCALGTALKTWPLFNPKTDMIAQNGCDAVILRQDGTALTVPGQEAAKLFEQYVKREESGWISNLLTLFRLKTPMKIGSLRVYLNTGHASLAFDSDQKHFGFYPSGGAPDQKEMFNRALQEQQRDFRVLPMNLAQSTVKKGIPSSGRDSLTELPVIKTGFSSLGSFLNLLIAPRASGEIPCNVIDDSGEKEPSDQTNQLMLRVFGSESQIQKARDYVEKTKKDCKTGEASYSVIGNNCIDFVQKALASTELKGDFRDAFTNAQIFRRLGAANLYSFAVSKGASSISFSFPTSLHELLNFMPRGAIKGMGAAVTGYITYLTAPTLIKNLGLGATKIGQTATVALLKAAAIGRFLFLRRPFIHA